MSLKRIVYHKLIFLEEKFQTRVSDELFELVLDSKEIDKIDSYTIPVLTIKDKSLMLRKLLLKSGDTYFIDSISSI